MAWLSGGSTKHMKLDDFREHASSIVAHGSEKDRRWFWKTVRLLIIGETKKCFTEQRTPGGDVWKPLAHPRYNSKGKDRPLRDTGILMAAATGRGPGHYEQQGEDYLIYGVNLDYASTHQEGATIVPVKGKFLAIPATVEAHRAGSPRNMPNLEVVIGKNGGVLIERFEGFSEEADIVHFYLTKKVVIPAREFLGVSEKMVGLFLEALGELYWRIMGGRQ